MEFIKRFFWMCSGASPLILKKCPSESNKYAGIGGTVFFTGVFAFFSGSYALFTVFKSPLPAIVFGIAWGGMIFNLDRYIVSSMKKEGDFWKEFRLAIPRIILAVLLAVVITKPLELRIFEREINAELVKMEQEVFKGQEDRVRDRFQPKVDKWNREIDKLKKEIGERIGERDMLALLAQQEADGTGGTFKRAMGPIYRLKKENADKAAADLARVLKKNQPILDRKARLIEKAEKQMSSTLNGLKHERYDSLAARIVALHNLSVANTAMNVANMFIFLLFIAIETAPVVVKLMSSRGPYDDLLKAHEHLFTVFRVERMAKLTHKSNERLKTLLDSEGKAPLSDEELEILPHPSRHFYNP